MTKNTKITLFRKTDTTLVYTASTKFAEEIAKGIYHYDFDVYIHVGRDKGSVTVYGDNDPNNIIPIDLNVREYILKSAEKDR